VNTEGGAVDAEQPDRPERGDAATTDADAPAAVAADAPEAAVSTAADVADAGAEQAATDQPYGEGSHGPLADDAQPDGFPIKGNADSKLYHNPDSPVYGRTVAEVWFATEDAAEAAGFSKPASQQKTDDES